MRSLCELEGMMATLEPLHQMVNKATQHLASMGSSQAMGGTSGVSGGGGSGVGGASSSSTSSTSPHNLTMSELSFINSYERDLAEASANCKQFERSNNQRDINAAWDIYYHVFKRISKQLQGMTTLELSTVSPKLLQVCSAFPWLPYFLSILPLLSNILFISNYLGIMCLLLSS